MIDRKTEVLAQLIQSRSDGRTFRRALVVGCGNGEEARDLADLLGCTVTAIDIADRFSASHPRVEFVVMDASDLTFAYETFDLVYSFHALEHIREPTKAIAEMRRVLKVPGSFCIGTPNRFRLVGYITGRGATFAQKIQWNIMDWRHKLNGTFRNELGAHAGYSIDELLSLCREIGPCAPATRDYYVALYGRSRAVIDAVGLFGAWPWLFPCEYVIGQKRSETDATAYESQKSGRAGKAVATADLPPVSWTV